MLIQSSIEHLPISDNSIDLIFTDPPYPKEYLQCYHWLADEAMRVLKPGGFILVMCGGLFLNQIFRFMDDAGLEYFFEMQRKNTNRNHTGTVVWKHLDGKQYPINTQTKAILAYSKFKSFPRMGNVCNFVESRGTYSKQFHHWGQDAESARYYIDYFSKENDLVLDPFIGGGTTAVACELINRRWIGCDVDAKAIQTTASRMSNIEIPNQTKLLL